MNLLNILRKQINDGEKSWYQILSILTGCLSSLLCGVVVAWPSPFITKITEDESYGITEAEASYFTLIQPLGMCLCAPLIAPVTNSLGRKKTILISAIPFTIALVIKAFAKNLWWLYFARFSSGAANAIAFAALPSYIGEIATPKVRGAWGNMFSCSVFFGQFLMNIIGSYFSVRDSSLILLSIPVIFVITFALMPESPYFYIMQGRLEDAKASLRRLRRKRDVDEEFEAIKKAVERQMSESGTWKDLICVKDNRNALFALLFLRVAQTYSGILVFSAYTQFIFEKAGGDVSAQTSAIMFTGLTFIAYSGSSGLSDKLGRRKAFISSSFLTAVVLFAEAIFFLIDAEYKQIDLSNLQWFPLTGLLIFVLVTSYGVGIVPTLMYGELFSASVKAQGVSAAGMVFALASISANYIFYLLISHIGLYGPFFLFGGCSLASTFLGYFLIPETKGKTLEEIQIMLQGRQILEQK